jgi:hypothetical protein
MGMRTEMMIEAFQKANGIVEPSWEEQELLRKMSDAAFHLIKVIELEKSGIRDGDGYWHGSDVMGGVTSELVSLIQRYIEETSHRCGADCSCEDEQSVQAP